MMQLKLTTILNFSIYFFTKVGKNRHSSRIALLSWAFTVTLFNGKVA